jgi:hypothetical protein
MGQRSDNEAFFRVPVTNRPFCQLCRFAAIFDRIPDFSGLDSLN